VRDHSGRLAWIEKSALGGARTVMVQNDTSVVRQLPRADAEVVFRAARGVLLELNGDAGAPGWLPVKHANGLTGWMPMHEAWGR
jgi:SH3-like domain-containing protein